MIDHYKVVGLPTGEQGRKLTEQDIKVQFRKRALILHPDKPTGNEAAFKELQASYEALLDKPTRNALDDELSKNRAPIHLNIPTHKFATTATQKTHTESVTRVKSEGRENKKRKVAPRPRKCTVRTYFDNEYDYGVKPRRSESEVEKEIMSKKYSQTVVGKYRRVSMDSNKPVFRMAC